MADRIGPGDVAALQQLVLTSALTGRPLPGGGLLLLPELAEVRRRRPIYLLAENLASAVSVPDSVQVVDRDRLARLAVGPEAGDDGKLYLAFGEAEPGASMVTLQVGIQRTSGPAILGGVVVEFTRSADGWQALPPAAFAT